MATPAEHAAMLEAVALARRGAGRTSPNPLVGAVVLDASGTPVGRGWHAQAGSAHAEVVALRGAGEKARGGTMVVTLEPCSHYGRTPPCSTAIAEAGIARLVYAVPDPTLVAGGGAAELAAEGIEVEQGVCQAEAERVNEAWLFAMGLRRPFVTWKVASTLDGRIAAPDGTSKWITSEAARADAHQLRATVDAILTGVGTVLADDPRMSVRDAEGREVSHQPLRVVLDSEGRTPKGAQVLQGRASTLVFIDEKERVPRHLALVAPVPRAEERVRARSRRLRDAPDTKAEERPRLDLVRVLDVLYGRGVRHVLLESGPTLAGAFVDADLVDRVVAYVAPALLGGRAPGILGGVGVETIADALRLHLDEVRVVGGDVRIEARPV